ncbi:MAG TPA: DoxX family protein [Gemmatimonadaceae bacterium]|jgi:putative oxidoreductase
MAVPYTIAQARVGWDDNGKLILRVTVAVLMVMHGIAKMQNGIGWMAGMLQSHHIPVFVGYGVYVAEVIAPILLLLGLFTRLAALVIAFDMVMAIVLAQSDKFFTRNQAGGWAVELEMFFLLASVAIFFLGSGRYAVRKGRHRWD